MKLGHQQALGKDEWKCVTTTHIGQCVTIAGIDLMQEWCADNLDTALKVMLESSVA